MDDIYETIGPTLLAQMEVLTACEHKGFKLGLVYKGSDPKDTVNISLQIKFDDVSVEVEDLGILTDLEHEFEPFLGAIRKRIQKSETYKKFNTEVQ